MPPSKKPGEGKSAALKRTLPQGGAAGEEEALLASRERRL